MAIQMNRLAGLITLLDEQLAALPPLGDTTAIDWWARREAHQRGVVRLCAMLERREGAQISNGSTASVTLANLRATATSGLEGALRNWRRAARAKLDLARGELAGAIGEA